MWKELTQVEQGLIIRRVLFQIKPGSIKSIMKRIQGKVIIVTGANRGIGRVIAEELLKAGADVVITGRNQEKLEYVQLEFEQMDYKPLAIAADLTNTESCINLIRSAKDHFGKIDGLVNNAGLPARGRFEFIDTNIFEMVLSGNILTAANCTKAALPELIKSRGSVIFISSVAAIHGLPNAAPYSAAKIALENLAESLRIELHNHHVHVGILRPGLVTPPPDKKVLRDDGTFQPVYHKGHQSQESVAKAVLNMLRKRSSKLTMTPAGKIMNILNRLAPWLVRYVLIQTQYSGKYEN